MKVAILVLRLLLEFNLMAGLFFAIEFLLWKLLCRVLVTFAGSISMWSLKMSIAALIITPTVSVIGASWYIVRKVLFNDITYLYETHVLLLEAVVFSALLVLWAIGVIRRLKDLITIRTYSRQLMRIGTEAPEEPIIREEAEKMGIRRKFEVARCCGIGSPQVLCMRGRCIIQFPQMDMPENMVRIIGRHELGHVKSRDHLKTALLHAVACIWWYNPLLYGMKDEVDMWEDICRDVSVIWGMPVDRVDYHDCMAAMIRLQRKYGKETSQTGAAFVKKSHFMRRYEIVKKICSKKPTKASYLAGLAITIAFIIISLGIAVVSVDLVRQGCVHAATVIRGNREVELGEGEGINKRYNGTTGKVEALDELSGIFKVNKTKTIQSKEIYLEENTDIRIRGFADNEDAVMKCGIYNGDDNISHYCNEKDIFMTTIHVPKAGKWIVYLEITVDEESEVEINTDYIIKED